MQHNFQLVKMYFDSPLHLSRGREDNYDKADSVLHSDTLQSALFVCARQLFGEEVGKEFFDSFRVSSAFPFQGDTLFLPKPASDAIFEEINLTERKHAKGVLYLPTDDFAKVCRGEKLEFEVGKTTKEDSNQFYVSGKVQIKTQVMQRVTIPRMQESDATPFYMERMFFGEEAGLYFVVKFEEVGEKKADYQKYFEASLRLLGEQGIGTDRNVGNGNFHVKDNIWDTLTLDLPENSDYWLNISLYCPEKKTLPALEESYFALVKRGGWMASPANENDMSLRKKSVYMFAEGSVFKADARPQGVVANLQPKDFSHPIWRDGRGIFLPFIKPNE